MATTMNASLWTNDRFYFWQTENWESEDVYTFLEHLDEEPSRLITILQQSKTVCKISNNAYDHIVQLQENEVTSAQAIARKIHDTLTKKDQQILIRTSIKESFAGTFTLEVMFGSTSETLDTFNKTRKKQYCSHTTTFANPETLLGKIQMAWSTTQEGIK